MASSPRLTALPPNRQLPCRTSDFRLPASGTLHPPRIVLRSRHIADRNHQDAKVKVFRKSDNAGLYTKTGAPACFDDFQVTETKGGRKKVQSTVVLADM